MSDIAPCCCGHAPEEHGDDPHFPGSTACTVEGCDCIAYDADPTVLDDLEAYDNTED